MDKIETRKRQVIAFADKWIAKFKDEQSTCYDLADDSSFSDDCFKLKFEMDCGHGFCDKYKVAKLEDAVNILSQVDDLDYLASAIFSHWRYFNHWAYGGDEIMEHRDWFIATLERLKELAE